MPVRVLSFHAAYRCRHAGACCTSAWPIPVEADRLAGIQAALATRALVAAVPAPIRLPAAAPADTPALLAVSEGCCVFYDREGRRCAVQRVLGHDALPLACRQFPRVTVSDPRGHSVTLSHYCPTAAATLLAPGPITIADATEAFPEGGEYVGLDASRALPPLLRPDMLMDWMAWWTFERLALELISSEETAHRALAHLRAIVEDVRMWRPAEGPLDARVDTAFRTPRREPGRRGPGPTDVEAAVYGATPLELRLTLDRVSERPVVPDERQRLAFLAAHAFANWTVHLGRGLRSWLRSCEAAIGLLDAYRDVRRVDLALRHLAVTERLAEAWSEAEREH